MRKLLILLCLVTPGLVACGDSGGGKDAADNETDSAAEKSRKPGDPEFTGKGGEQFCDYLVELQANTDQLSLSNEVDPVQQEKAKAGLEVFEKLEEKAPSEIKSDVVIVIEQVKPFFVAVAAGKPYEPGPEDTPSEAEAKAFQEAGARVSAYSGEVCKLDPPAGTGGGAGPSESPLEGEQAPGAPVPPADE